MTKSELIQAVAQRLPHLSTRDVEIVVNTVFGSVTGALQRGDRIEIRGFGSFFRASSTGTSGSQPQER